jgi:hypothetical protein
MKKFTCISLSILIFSFFIGCIDTEDNNYADKIIGDWWVEQSDLAEGFLIYYSFYENGTLKIDVNFSSINLSEVFGNYSDIITSLWPMKGEYIITKYNISMKYPLDKPNETPDIFIPYNYTFIDNNTKLELEDIYNQITVLNRIE